MKCFTLTVSETLSKQIDVEADCIEDAISESFERYGNGDIELEKEDVIHMDIEEYGN